MMYGDLLLLVHTATHTYVARREQIHRLHLVSYELELATTDERGRPIVPSDLGPLLDAEDMGSDGRAHALIVQLRRRSVAFLVERVDDLRIEAPLTELLHPLPPLLARRLARPWFMGVLLWHDEPCLVLDLRQIAQDVIFNRQQAS
jgi:chemotaxis signal transduction protein